MNKIEEAIKQEAREKPGLDAEICCIYFQLNGKQCTYPLHEWSNQKCKDYLEIATKTFELLNEEPYKRRFT